MARSTMWASFVLILQTTLGARVDTTTSPVVDTNYGSLVGTTSWYRPGVEVFKGIPYAGHQTAENRWKPPKQLQPWGGIRNATNFAADCIAIPDTFSLWSTGWTNQSEDCLYLNIWRPANRTSKNLPVYVWYYGGRFAEGSGAVVTYDGSGLAALDIIVVTVNSRVGPLGFLAHPELAEESAHNSTANYGVLDMQMALQWVRDEIHAFGGNPDHIYVGGQSSGSSSALDMLYSPLSTKYVAGVIAESGARAPRDPLTGSLATSYAHREEAYEFTQSWMQTLNVTSLAQLRKEPASFFGTWAAGQTSATLFEGTHWENNTNFSEPPGFRPMLDGYVLNSTYYDTLRYGAHADVPIMTGNNKDESGAVPMPNLTVSTYYGNFSAMFLNMTDRFLELYPANNDSQANHNSNQLWRDLSRVSSWEWAQEWHRGGAKQPVWTYFWTHAPPSQTTGAFHGAEMIYVFNNMPYAYPTELAYTQQDFEIQDTVVQYWANFIKSGDPNGGNTTKWEPSGEPETMWIGDSYGMGEIATPERQAFLLEFLARQKPW